MAASNTAWGIELGSGAIKAIKLAATDDGVEILEYAHVPHSKVLSTPDLDVDDAMRVALGQFAATRDLTKASVGVGIPGNQSFARFAKLPPVEPKKVPEIVKFEAIQQIPFGLEEVEWDYQTFASDDSPEIEVGIFAVTRDRVNKQLAMLKDLGITPDTVMVNPVAAFNAMSYDLRFTEDTPGTVILDVGTNSTDLIVADQGRVWIRTFPLGGHHFTEALVNAFKLGYSKADRLKREAEKSRHARHVFQAMKGVFSDLAQETQRSIGYYQSLHPEAELNRIIGIGSTFNLPGLRRYLKQHLQIEVYRVEEFKRVKADDDGLPEDLQQLSVEMMTAYGLALQGLGLNTIEANLMPVSELRQAVWKKKTKWMGIAAGLSVAASGAMFLGFVKDQASLPTEPPIIRQVRGTLSTLQSEAEEAGVTQAGADTALAEELLKLGNEREAHARIVADVSELLAHADREARSWQGGAGPAKGFEFVELSTTFVAGSAGGDATSGRGGFGGPADPNAAYDRINIELSVTSSQPDARDFLLQTVRPWLVANAEREGVEYTLVGMNPELQYADLSGVGGAQRGPGGRGAVGGPRGASRPTGRDAGFEREQVVSPTRGGGGSRRGAIPGGRRGVGFEPGGQPGETEERSAIQSLSLNDLAPLPQKDLPESASGFVIRWTAAFIPEDAGLAAPPAAEEAPADDGFGGGGGGYGGRGGFNRGDR